MFLKGSEVTMGKQSKFSVTIGKGYVIVSENKSTQDGKNKEAFINLMALKNGGKVEDLTITIGELFLPIVPDEIDLDDILELAEEASHKKYIDTKDYKEDYRKAKKARSESPIAQDGTAGNSSSPWQEKMIRQRSCNLSNPCVVL